MKLIIYGIIIGIAKIIPGVSGSLLAISLGVYEKAIHTITHFFDNKKENILFITKLSLGIIIGIVLFSKIILYLITNYYFYSVLLFIGLILSTIIKQFKGLIINKKIVITSISILIIISNIPYFKLNIENNTIYFIAGIIEVFSTLIPGISGTALFISLGIYNNILELISNTLNINYLITNFIKYILYILGMFSSFLVCSLLIDYLYQKHKNTFNNIVLGLSIGSIILLLLQLDYHLNIIRLLFGLFLFILGIFIGLIL